MNLSETDKRKLRDAFAVRASVNGNVMSFIGLDAVREKYPAMWDRNRDRILATTHAILKQYTNPQTDVVLPVSDGNFVVLFTQLQKQEAALRAAAIKAEVLRRFMGDDALETLDLQTQAMELDSETFASGTLGGRADAAPPSGAGPAPVSRRAAGPEGASAGSVEKVYRASMADLLSHAELPLETLAKRFDFSFDTLDFAFQPFLYAAKGVFSIFACRAVRYSATGDILTGYGVLPREPDADHVRTLDTMVLARARHGLVDMALRRRVAIVVVPVSFETMTDRACSTEYLAQLQKIPSDLRNYLVPTVCRCPAGVPEGRLAEIVSPLKRLSRAVSMRLESAMQPLSTVKAAGVFSVGFNLAAAAGTEMAAPGFVDRFGAGARKLGLHTYVEGIDGPEVVARCRAAKIDYLAGHMFAELSDYVGPVCPMQVA